MRKIGIATLALLAVATAACGESPVGASAPGAEASLSVTAREEGLAGSEQYEAGRPGFGGSGTAIVGVDERVTMQMEGNPGLLGSGH